MAEQTGPLGHYVTETEIFAAARAHDQALDQPPMQRLIAALEAVVPSIVDRATVQARTELNMSLRVCGRLGAELDQALAERDAAQAQAAKLAGDLQELAALRATAADTTGDDPVLHRAAAALMAAHQTDPTGSLLWVRAVDPRTVAQTVLRAALDGAT